jgi:serine/threonine protein kinase
MPLLDADPDSKWYVMPLADGDLMTLRSRLDDAGLVDLVAQAAKGLRVAHDAGWVHRDIKPQNLLRLPGDDDIRSHWVVADWGLVRGPRGITTHPLTSTHDHIGTEGFIAPEVLDGAHQVTPAADVFSLARVLTWAVTGRWPLAGDFEPPPGVFRRVVRRGTARDPSQRLSLDAFVRELRGVSLGPLPTPRDPPAELLRRVLEGDEQAVEELVLLADAHPDDPAIHLDYVAKIPPIHLVAVASCEPQVLYTVAQNLARHLEESFGGRDLDYINVILGWILGIAQAAERNNDLGLLADAVDLLFELDPRWDRWRHRERARDWLEQLRGAAAETVARSLLASPKAVEFYGDGDWHPRASAPPEIRAPF